MSGARLAGSQRPQSLQPPRKLSVRPKRFSPGDNRRPDDDALAHRDQKTAYTFQKCTHFCISDGHSCVWCMLKKQLMQVERQQPDTILYPKVNYGTEGDSVALDGLAGEDVATHWRICEGDSSRRAHQKSPRGLTFGCSRA